MISVHIEQAHTIGSRRRQKLPAVKLDSTHAGAIGGRVPMSAEQSLCSPDIAIGNRLPDAARSNGHAGRIGHLVTHRDLNAVAGRKIADVVKPSRPTLSEAEIAAADHGADIELSGKNVLHEADGAHGGKACIEARTKQQIEAFTGKGKP